MESDNFKERFAKLNDEQKEAVDAIDGPVMVIAGPGTGKTQILSMRIANILKKTDTPADGILCLTFTNSGVHAMRERLLSIVGPEANKVKIGTFHSFAGEIIEEFFNHLGLDEPPRIMDEKESIVLADELFENENWEYLRGRTGGVSNFKDLMSFISLAKRERMTPDDIYLDIKVDVEESKNNPNNISSRGPTKGELKKDVTDKLSRLERTKEAVKFFELFEKTKKERNLADYDDVLEMLVQIVKESDEAKSSIRERFLYVLVDEHQDSSGVQNDFLEEVWGDVERPNIFVVGDDRQLIYGFGGASLSHFERVARIFSGIKIISLTQNYRSTQKILDCADCVFESAISKEKLVGKGGKSEKINLIEAQYPRDEIIVAGISIKQKISEGISPSECALFVPKNWQAREAIDIFSDMGIPVSALGKTSLWSDKSGLSFIKILRVISEPYENKYLASLLLDEISGVTAMEAHKFIHEYGRYISIEKLKDSGGDFLKLAEKLIDLIEKGKKESIYSLIQEISSSFFIKNVTDHDKLIKDIEATRTFLNLADAQLRRNKYITLQSFVAFIDRLIEYGADIPIATFGSDDGVKIMTLHASKGLEFEYVWIAHMNENSLMKGKNAGFTLPSLLAEKSQKKDEMSARRELFVAITRAKTYCTISYSAMNVENKNLEIARIIRDIPDDMFVKKSSEQTRDYILSHGAEIYVEKNNLDKGDVMEQIRKIVSEKTIDAKLAVTHLNNFFNCPWKWYFRNFIKLPEKEGESLVIGNIAHVLVSEIVNNREISENDLEKIIETKLDEARVWNDKDRNRYKKDAKKIIDDFKEDILPQIAVDALSESDVNVATEKGRAMITGKIDLLEKIGENYRVSDFKTGRVKSKGEIEKETDGRMSDMMRQLAMYSYLLKNKKDGEINVSTSRLIFLESDLKDKNRIYSKIIGPDELEKIEKDIADFFEFTKNGSWTNLRCNFVPKGAEKACIYCTLINGV